jgi:1-acyl-sn-glycerol-3-phosphate acyltransferase
MKKHTIRLVQLFIVLLIRLRFAGKVKVFSENLKVDGKVVIASNHVNQLDPFIIACFLPIRTIVKLLPYSFMTANIYYYRWWQPLAFLVGCFPAKPQSENSPTSAYGVDAAVRLLNDGYSLVMFPEGKRTKKPIEAKPGISRILQKNPAQLMLCHIHWSKQGGKLAIQMAVEMSDNNLNKKDPQAIMQGAYALPFKAPQLKVAEIAKKAV